MNEPIDISKIASVYNGDNNACCCGCSGKHSYAKAHQQLSSTRRGYPVRDEEINDREVVRIVRALNRRLDEVQDLGGTCLVLEYSPKRVYIAYTIEH